MRVIAICLLAVGVCGLLLSGCGKEEEAPATPPAKVETPEKPAADTTKEACACEAGKAGGTVWCPECNVGYVKGEKTECKDCVASATEGKGKCEKCAAG